MKHSFINKKTGAEARVIAMYLDSDGVMQVDGYDTVEDLMDDYAAYERYNPPKEPLIKDEKIRNAVRAWAKANGIGGCVCKEEIHCITFETERGMFISFENADPIPPEGNFTISDLCGEEEE